ncbi:hypothetical protein LP032_089 [Listeria phage LP-032]|uniref:Uncharacterized protein n=1 Tax=Listeria phage LP-032 TaxID=1173746 RepID=A0A059T5I3_9CAUD|nr:hypothetical protein LP032_089 [Listeria phage LP-032]
MNNIKNGEAKIPEPIKEVKIELRYKIGEEIYYLNPETKERELAKVLGFGVEEDSKIQYYHISTLDEPQKELKVYLKDIGKVYLKVEHITTLVFVYFAGKEIKYIPGENCEDVVVGTDKENVYVSFKDGKTRCYHKVPFMQEHAEKRYKHFTKNTPEFYLYPHSGYREADIYYNYYDEEKVGLYEGSGY